MNRSIPALFSRPRFSFFPAWCWRVGLVAAAAWFSGALHAQTLTITNGLQFWLKADAGITTNATGDVTQWNDQSGNSNNAAPPSDAMAPKLVQNALNAKPVVHFDGVDDYLDVPTSPSIENAGDISSFFVVKFDDFATYRAVWAKTAVNLPASTDYYLLPNTGVPRAYRGAGVVTDIASVDATTAVRAGNYVVLGFEQAGTVYTHYLNGQAVGSGPLTATLVDGGTPLKVGTRDDFVTRMKGDIAEIVIYDRALDPTERNSLVTYLQTKYGIVNQPPTINLTTPGNNTSVAAPALVTVTATASDSDGIVSKVDFFANGALIGTATASPYKVRVWLETAGTIVFNAVATDNKDATATTTNVTVTVTGAGTNTAPVTDSLQLWLKADAGVTAGADKSVTLWKDQSGVGNDAAQPDTTLAPLLVDSAINGKPALRFDGVDDYLDVASTPSLAITGDIASFFVVRFDDFANYRSIWGKTSSNVPRPNDYYLVIGSGIPRFYRGTEDGGVNAFADGGKVSAGNYVLLGFSQTGSTVTHYQNGPATGTGQINITPTDSGLPLKVGSRDDLFTKMKGDIAELLIYSKGLSDTERVALESYLGTKYGLPVLEPTNTPPLVNITVPANGLVINSPSNFSATATATDTDGSIVKVDFYANGGLVGTATKSPFKVTFLVPTAGTITLKAVATDNLGAKTTSANVTFSATSATPSALTVRTNLALWLKADGGVTKSGDASASAPGPVTGWADFSGNFNNAAPTDPSSAPEYIPNGLNQHPVIRFDGVNDYLQVPSAPSLVITGDITSVFVVKFEDFATYRAVWSKTAGNVPRPTDYYLQPDTGLANLLRGGPGGNLNFQATDPFPANEFVIGGFEIEGTTATHYLNGSPIGSGDLAATPADSGTPLLIGTRGDFVTRMKGDIAEILIYSAALSDGDRDKVIGYLNSKYFTPVTNASQFTSIRLDNNNVIFAWTGSDKLEEAPDITGPWTAVSPAPNPYQVAPSGQRKFYRLHP